MKRWSKFKFDWDFIGAIPLIPIVILVMPILAFLQVLDIIRARKFWTKNQGQNLFFYSNKYGWADFLINNIIPVLPPNTLVYNLYKDKKNPHVEVCHTLDKLKIPREKRRLPFLIKIKSNSPLVYSFHAEYFALKNLSAKRDAELQIKIKEPLIAIFSEN